MFRKFVKSLLGKAVNFDKCYKCNDGRFFSNGHQVRCAKCGGFHCLPAEFKGPLLTSKQSQAIQRKSQADKLAGVAA